MSLEYKYDAVSALPDPSGDDDPAQLIAAHNANSNAHPELFEGKLMIRALPVPDEETALEQSALNPDIVYWWEE